MIGSMGFFPVRVFLKFRKSFFQEESDIKNESLVKLKVH